MSSAIWEKSIEDFCDNLTRRVAELEGRMVKLEAYMRAARDERRLVSHAEAVYEEAHANHS